MATLVSRYSPLCAIMLPFKGRQHYMHEIDCAAVEMPEDLKDYEQPVRELLDAARVKGGRAFVTVDEKMVLAGQSQRRPGPHVDGCFQPERGRWGHGGWNHNCNNVPIPRMSVIVASSFPACKVWEGDFDTEPKNDGDLSHISDQLVYGEIVPANVGYLLSPDCVHESLPMEKDTERSFLRIALSPECFA